MALGLGSSLIRGGASLLTYVKDNLKLYLDFKSSRSDTLAFPSEGSTSFDGNDYITISHSSDLSFGTNAHTISAWAKIDALANYKTIISKRQAGGTATDYNLSVGANGVVYTYNGSNVAQTATGVISAGSWFHYALVYSGSAYQLYINGSAVAWDSGTATSGASNSHDIGIGWDRTGNYWDGQITNVALWSRELEPEEVQSVMNKSYSQLGSVEKTSLVMWQSLDSVDATGRMDTPAVGTGAITTSFPTNIYLNSHGTTEYTEVMANNGSLATQGAWTIHSDGADSAFEDTGVYSEGALKAKNKIITKVAVNSTNASVLEAFIVGQLYKFEITYTRVDGQHAQSWYIGINESYGGVNDLIFKEGYWNNDDDGAPEKTITGYFIHQASKNFLWVRIPTSSVEIHIKSISIKKVTNNAGGGGISITNNNNHYDATLTQGATTTTSVYGGNAPILPRAIDIAESFADAIGNGSALFNGSTDLIQVNASSSINNLFEAGGTFTAWVNLDSAGEVSGRVAQKGFVIYTSTSDGSSSCKLSFNAPFSETSGDWITNNREMIYGEWQHIAITYSGSSTSNNPIIYINGISVAITRGSIPDGTISADTADLYIGNRSDTARAFDGEMSQLGLWRGVLSQAQIQSLMESTSYAKIPADVKSTLGSELMTDGNFDSGISDFDNNSTGWVYRDNALGVVDGSATTAIYARNNSDSGTITAGGLYKVQFTVVEESGGNLRMRIGAGSYTYIYDSGTYTKYIIAGSNTSEILNIYAEGNWQGYIDNISVKEVTNDLVAFYPLDADSSRSNGTDDVTTGEVLGNEMFPTSNSVYTVNDHYEKDSANPPNLTYKDTGTGTVTIIDSDLGETISGTGICKLTITISGLTSGQANFKTQSINFANTYVDETMLDNGTYTFYFTRPSGGGNGFLFRSDTASGSTFTISDYSLKRVTSNTGVLK